MKDQLREMGFRKYRPCPCGGGPVVRTQKVFGGSTIRVRCLSCHEEVRP